VLVAPLQLLSPHAGIAMAMAPGVGPLPCRLPADESFPQFLFPDFDETTFIWKATLTQFAMFGVSLLMGHDHGNPTPCALYRLGASWGPAIASGQVFRLLSPMLLHASFSHLVFNVFFQLRMGFGMERQFGRDRFAALYVLCGLYGNLLSAAAGPMKLAVGASTAGFGLIGVWLAELLLSWHKLGPARGRSAIWVGIMLTSVISMSMVTPSVDLFGHLGGALAGFLLGIVMSDLSKEDRPAWHGHVRVAAALGLALGLIGPAVKLFAFTAHAPLPACAAAATAFLPVSDLPLLHVLGHAS